MGPKNFFASKKIFKLADARSTFDASIESCGRCSGQIFKGKCYVIFTLVLLLSLFFFYQEHGPPMPVYAKGRPDGRRGRRPEAAGDRPEAGAYAASGDQRGPRAPAAAPDGVHL